MKVVIVCAAGLVSGKEIMTLQLLTALKERGHDVYCITSNWGTPDFKTRLAERGIPFSKIRIGFISKTLSWPAIRMTLHQGMYIPKMLFDYRSIIRKQDPDVVIHTNFHHVFVLYPVIKTNRRNFYWSHEFAGNSSFYQRLFRMFNRKMNLFIGVSGAIGRSLESLIGTGKVVVVRNGIAAPTGFQRKAERKPYPVIGIVGQVVDHKGHSVLFDALKDFRTWKQRPSVEIIGGGDPVYVNELRQRAKDLGIEAIIQWRGFVSDPSEIYGTMDVIVVPTKLPDPYPTVVMEAGLRGIPAIVSDSGGLPEMVVPGVNGLIFKTGSSEALAAAFRELPAEEDYRKLSDSTKEFAEKRFSLSNFVDGFEKLITGNG